MVIVAIILGSLLIVELWEFWRPRRRREFPALGRRCANIAFWISNLILAALILGPPVAFRDRLVGTFGIGLPDWPIADTGLTFLAAFLLLDFLRYAVHRTEHAVPWLWRMHALHHSDPDVDVTTSVRHHPSEYLLSSAIYWTALVVLDVPAGAALTYGLAVIATAALQHGNIRLPAPIERWLQPLFLTPDLHRVHHSIEQRGANANFGAVLSLWDRIFGTLTSLTPAGHDAIVFGVAELPRADGLKPLAMLLTPWRLGRAMRRARAAG
jgi:sterol desaturase/sphingolipid hydroxylase (fatty acid hydroxylase superfamily)